MGNEWNESLSGLQNSSHASTALIHDKFMKEFEKDHVRLWGWTYEEVKAALRIYQSNRKAD